MRTERGSVSIAREPAPPPRRSRSAQYRRGTAAGLAHPAPPQSPPARRAAPSAARSRVSHAPAEFERRRLPLDGGGRSTTAACPPGCCAARRTPPASARSAQTAEPPEPKFLVPGASAKPHPVAVTSPCVL